MRLQIPALLFALYLSIPDPSRAAIVDVSVGPGNAFSPQSPQIVMGDTVRWTRLGGLHNVNSDEGAFRSGDPSSAWTTFEYTFDVIGTFGYHCEVHGAPGVAMFGVVTVGSLFSDGFESGDTSAWSTQFP